MPNSSFKDNAVQIIEINVYVFSCHDGAHRDGVGTVLEKPGMGAEYRPRAAL